MRNLTTTDKIAIIGIIGAFICGVIQLVPSIGQWLGWNPFASPTTVPILATNATSTIVAVSSSTPTTKPSSFATLAPLLPTVAQTRVLPTATSSRLLPVVTPIPGVKEYVTITTLETRHISLKAGELIVGTADRWQDVDKAYQPYTAFLIQGPIEYDLKIFKGGWDHDDWQQRGINLVRLP